MKLESKLIQKISGEYENPAIFDLFASLFGRLHFAGSSPQTMGSPSFLANFLPISTTILGRKHPI